MNAIHEHVERVEEEVLKLRRMLDVASEGLSLADGRFCIKHAPGYRYSFIIAVRDKSQERWLCKHPMQFGMFRADEVIALDGMMSVNWMADHSFPSMLEALAFYWEHIQELQAQFVKARGGAFKQFLASHQM